MSTDVALLVADLEACGGAGPVVPKCVIETLPAELLATIFQEIIVPERPKPIRLFPGEKSRRANEFDTKPLITLSHVCQYWRDVALVTPALWRRIHGRCRHQMAAFLERSRPLTVALFLAADPFGEQLNQPLHEYAAVAVEAHAQRLRRLDLAMVPAREHVDPLLSSLRAPHLESLTIISSCYITRGIDTELFLTPLLSGETLSLRALAIMPVVNWMPSSPLPHLTHLLLSIHDENALCHPFDILHLLANTPMLHFLHVDYLITNVSYHGDWQPPSNPIPLHHLRSLIFTLSLYDLMHALVSRLSLPEDVFICLQRTIDLDGHPISLPPLSLHPVTSLDIAVQATQVLVIANGPTSGLWFSGYHDQAHLPPGERANWLPWLRTLPACLSLFQVTYLHINIDHDDEQFVLWRELLPHMPQVSHLAVLLASSSDPPRSSSAPTTLLSRVLAREQTVLCPVLRTLTIEWLDPVRKHIVESYRELPKMLAARGRAGHPLRRVVMQTMLDDRFEDARSEVVDFVEDLRRATEDYETEYELVVKGEIGEELCAYKMRDVWRVDGEERYWEVGDMEKPFYILPTWLGGFSWSGYWW